MDNTGYITLTRQQGLERELRSIANNVANLSTTGFRGDGVIFSEHVVAGDDPSTSLSMASADVRKIDMRQGPIEPTNGTYDFAIEGDGFFLVATPTGERLTRAGNFRPDADGTLVSADGYQLLDAGQTPIVVPPNAQGVLLADDGTLSADGRAIAQIGLWQPVDEASLTRNSGATFDSSGVEPATTQGTLLQGFLESSNVEPVWEMARMVELQRNYELGQSFIEEENERQRTMVQTLTE